MWENGKMLSLPTITTRPTQNTPRYALFLLAIEVPRLQIPTCFGWEREMNEKIPQQQPTSWQGPQKRGCWFDYQCHKQTRQWMCGANQNVCFVVLASAAFHLFPSTSCQLRFSMGLCTCVCLEVIRWPILNIERIDDNSFQCRFQTLVRLAEYDRI